MKFKPEGFNGKNLRKLVLTLGALGATTEALSQKPKDEEKKKQNIEVVGKKSDAPYAKDKYTPGSQKYNPLQVYKDLGLLFNLEKIKEDTTGYAVNDQKARIYDEKLDEWQKKKKEISLRYGDSLITDANKIKEIKSELDSVDQAYIRETDTMKPQMKILMNMFDAPLSLELKKLEESRPKIDPKDYPNKDEFIKEYVSKMEDWLSKDGKSKFDLRNAYFKGKAIYCQSLLDKYKNNFKQWQKDKPAGAINTDDWSASPAWNESKEDIDYSNEENFKEVIKQWQDFVDDADDVNKDSEDEDRSYGKRVYSLKYEVDNLGKEAIDEWNKVHNNREWQKNIDKQIKEAEQNLENYKNKKENKPILKRALDSVGENPLPEIKETRYNPEPKGDIIYGPSNGAIGYMNEGRFTPIKTADHLQGGTSTTPGANKQDLDLLKSPSVLFEYLKEKYGEYFKGIEQ